MEQFKYINYEQDAKKYRLVVIFAWLAFAAIPLLAILGFLKPSDEPLNIWFQRSGSIMVLIASFAEYYSIKMDNVFSPTLLANEPLFNTKAKYCLQAKKLMAISAIFIGLGTLVWGYGDVLL